MERYDENRSLNPVLRGHKCSVIGCDFRTTNLQPFLMDHVINPPDKCRQLRQLQFGPLPNAAQPGSPNLLPFWSFEKKLRLLLKSIQWELFLCMFFRPHLTSQESHWVSSMCALLHLKYTLLFSSMTMPLCSLYLVMMWRHLMSASLVIEDS